MSDTAERYRFLGWPTGLDQDVRARLARGDVRKGYHRVRFTDPNCAYFFATPEDNPYDCSPSSCVAFWADVHDKEPKLYVQLGAQFPPLLWIVLKPSVKAVRMVLECFRDNDIKFLEENVSKYEQMLLLGEQTMIRDDRLLAQSTTPETPPAPKTIRYKTLTEMLDHSKPQAIANTTVETAVATTISTPPATQQFQNQLRTDALLARANPQYCQHPLTPYGEKGSEIDLFRRAAGRLAVLSPEREHAQSAWFHLGTTISPEDVETKLMGNPFVFARWPSAVVGGEQRRTHLSDAVLCSSFRTVFSKSNLFFTTRDDEPHVKVNVEDNHYAESSTLYCHVDSPQTALMSGGVQVVERYNREFGTDYPLTTPVDVLGALALFQCKAVSQVCGEYDVSAGTFLDMTRDASLEIAKRQRGTLTPKEAGYVGALEKLAAERDPVAADDASHPTIVALVGYIRRLAVMKYDDFEDRCFKPFWMNDSKYVRIKVHEACIIAGRTDLAQMMLSRESDAYVVNACCDVQAKNVVE